MSSGPSYRYITAEVRSSPPQGHSVRVALQSWTDNSQELAELIKTKPESEAKQYAVIDVRDDDFAVNQVSRMSRYRLKLIRWGRAGTSSRPSIYPAILSTIMSKGS